MQHYTLILLLFATPLCRASYSIDTLYIQSDILNETRELVIIQPDELTINDSVNLLVLVDGGYVSYHYEQLCKSDLCHNLIAVGIIQTNRRRDLLAVNEAHAFSSFIKDEVITQLDDFKRVSRTILFGHSFGGAFTLYHFLNYPGYFSHYICSSPTPIMQLIDPILYRHADSSLTTKKPIILSYGSKDMGQVRKYIQRWETNIQQENFAHINWQLKVYEGFKHHNVEHHALQESMRKWNIQ